MSIVQAGRCISSHLILLALRFSCKVLERRAPAPALRAGQGSQRRQRKKRKPNCPQIVDVFSSIYNARERHGLPAAPRCGPVHCRPASVVLPGINIGQLHRSAMSSSPAHPTPSDGSDGRGLAAVCHPLGLCSIEPGAANPPIAARQRRKGGRPRRSRSCAALPPPSPRRPPRGGEPP